MREASRGKERLNHILEAIKNIEQYSSGKTFNDVADDKLLRHALTWNIQVIGEAANNITKEFTAIHIETNWRGITGMRHVLVHDYYQIDAEELWNVIENDLQPLKQQIEQYLSEMDEIK